MARTRQIKLNATVMPPARGTKQFKVCVRVSQQAGSPRSGVKYRAPRQGCAAGRTPALALAAALSRLGQELRHSYTGRYFKR